MHTTLKFFIVGAIIGIIIGLAPYPSEIQYDGDLEKYFKQVFSGTIKIAQVVFIIITIIILPFVAIEPLKKRLSPKDFLPLSLLMGSSFTLSIITLISVFATLI
ncbi:MAG: hypothetical protein IH842_00645 [Thaumarchaeota archaeon]|jgi:ABC-type amino acid transport system permease subunit|nr:hypothetical protein [Nitrososphaerota archaeon]